MKHLLPKSVFGLGRDKSVSPFLRSEVLSIHYSILAVLVISISGDVESNPGPASITNSYQASGFLQSRGLKVAHLNIRSIYNKIDSLKLLLNEKPFDIFTISETWLNSDITDGEISIPGYTFSRNDRKEDLVVERWHL